uniref:Uncharacterized protein n=1 Tax=Oryza barthii TaxID=65489 RepID=A0A0D3HTM9_9ORYZ
MAIISMGGDGGLSAAARERGRGGIRVWGGGAGRAIRPSGWGGARGSGWGEFGALDRSEKLFTKITPFRSLKSVRADELEKLREEHISKNTRLLGSARWNHGTASFPCHRSVAPPHSTRSRSPVVRYRLGRASRFRVTGSGSASDPQSTVRPRSRASVQWIGIGHPTVFTCVVRILWNLKGGCCLSVLQNPLNLMVVGSSSSGELTVGENRAALVELDDSELSNKSWFLGPVQSFRARIKGHRVYNFAYKPQWDGEDIEKNHHYHVHYHDLLKKKFRYLTVDEFSSGHSWVDLGGVLVTRYPKTQA